MNKKKNFIINYSYDSFNFINKLCFNSVSPYFNKLLIYSNFNFSYKNNNSFKKNITEFNDKKNELKYLLKQVNNENCIIKSNIIINNYDSNLNFILSNNNDPLFINLNMIQINDLLSFIDNNNYEDIIIYIKKKFNYSKNLLNISTIEEISQFVNETDYMYHHIMDYDFININIKNFLKNNFEINNYKINTSFSRIIKNNISKNIKILITSTQYPGYGGAATNCYYMHKYLENIGYNVCSIYFHNKEIKNYNPSNLKNVYLFVFKKKLPNIENIRNIILDNFGYPEIILSKNTTAPIYSKTLFPFSYLVYLVSGINHIPMFFPDKTALEFLEYKGDIPIIKNEIFTINLSDKIICNSNLTIKIFKKIYKNSCLFDKPINTTNTNNLEIPKKKYERKYDIIISSSRIDRIDKNILFLDKFINNMNLKICVIGDNYDIIKHWKNTDFYGLIPNNKCIELMLQSKILLFPSIFDSNSNTVMEAIKSGCIVLSTINIGNRDFMDDEFILKDFNPNTWSSKIKYILKNYDEIVDSNTFNKNNFSYENSILDFIENFSKKKYLITSTQYPGYGGAATNAYKIINFLKKHNFNVMGLFYQNNINKNYENYIVRDRNYNDKKECIKFLGGEPDFIYSKNYLAPILSKKIFPSKKHIYLVSGSLHATELSNINKWASGIFKMPKEEIYDIIKKKEDKLSQINKEKETIKIVDIILFNSYLTEKIFTKFYDLERNYITSDTSTLTQIKKNNIINKIKTNDILFISSELDRKVKNFKLFLNIILDKRLDKYNKIIIGTNSNKFKNIKLIKNCTLIDNVKNEEIYEYYQKSRVLLITSFFDSSPNVLNEALISNCEVICSNSIGSYDYLKKENVLFRFHNDPCRWVEKVLNILKINNNLINI